MEKISITDNEYPVLLKKIPDPPEFLFFEGNLDILKNKCASVVGTRKMTAYGNMATVLLSKSLANAGVTIVSGLAFGVDALSHKTAIENNGATAAVLPSGIDFKSITPKANFNLAKNIIKSGGLILSEYKNGTKAHRASFHARNRIIAGLSALTLVVEADFGSGALITANFAQKYKRIVATIPHSIFSRFGRGANELIKSGALCATAPQDILKALNIKKINNFQGTLDLPTNINKEKIKIIFNKLEKPLGIDELAASAQLNIVELVQILTELELKNIIKFQSGIYFLNKQNLQ